MHIFIKGEWGQKLKNKLVLYEGFLFLRIQWIIIRCWMLLIHLHKKELADDLRVIEDDVKGKGSDLHHMH